MKSDDGVNIVVLSAGKGTRMQSELPKVLHKIGGLTLLQHIVISVENLNCDKNIIITTSNDVIDGFADFLNKDKKLNYVIQEKRLGTGHAVNCAMESKFWHSDSMYTGVFYGDVPFIKQETISDMFESLGKFDLIILGFDAKDQSQAYGRLFTDKELMVGQCGKLFAIKEFRELPREKPHLCNSGIMVGKTEIFEKLLPQIKNNNKAKEYYLTDIVELANQFKYKVGTLICDEYEVIGINSRIELHNAEQEYQQKKQEYFMLNGATLLNAESVYFSYDTKIGTDVIIEPNVFFGLGVEIGNNCRIGAGSYLENIKIDNNTNIEPNSVLKGLK